MDVWEKLRLMSLDEGTSKKTKCVLDFQSFIYSTESQEGQPSCRNTALPVEVQSAR